MEKVNKKIFETVDQEKNKLFLAVVRPKPGTVVEAKRLYSKTVTRLLQKGEAIPRARVMDVLRETGLWNDEKTEQLKKIEDEMDRLEEIVRKGRAGKINEDENDYIVKFGMKKFAKKLALDLYRKRLERTFLISETLQLDACVAESIAEKEMYDYLTAHCTVWGNNEGKENKVNARYFENYDDFINRMDEIAARDARREFENFYNDVGDEDWRKKLPEFQLLAKYRFVNDKLQLIDEDGNLVNEDGQRIDENGNVLDKDGKPVVEEAVDTIADFEDVPKTEPVK